MADLEGPTPRLGLSDQQRIEKRILPFFGDLPFAALDADRVTAKNLPVDRREVLGHRSQLDMLTRSDHTAIPDAGHGGRADWDALG